ncbi:hypothetical protein EJ07DRAFT_170920 [Lizonia empirigonia]|nr:hypothetical protein EJ07DRAFT_170920 [Lizonia empirigonia]
MAFRHDLRAATQTPELILSDSEDSGYSSEDEKTEREQVDHLLKQAHHYVITEGGNDSPTTYMERIQRIDRSLLREITEHDYDCDRKLYRAVKQKVDHVQREFEDAIDADSSICDYNKMPEYYTAAAEGTLYRVDSSPATPEAPFTRGMTKPTTEDDLERTYLYGGPDNQPECWYNKAAASLPFPETIRMADWESLRIHWDFATTGNMERIEPATFNGVSFRDPLLAHHDSLAQYESGSRFKLPAIQPSDMTNVNSLGTPDKLHKAIEAFSQSDDTKKRDGEYKYAPRIFLERLNVGHQTGPQGLIEELRSIVNTTPTRPRASISGSSNIGPVPPAARTWSDKQQHASGEDIVSDSIETENGNNPPVTSTVIEVNKDHTRITSSRVSSHTKLARSPAIRRIKAATEAATRSSPQPQSPPIHIEITSNKVATHVSMPAKKPRGRPCKSPAAAAEIPAYQSTAAGTKRKRLNKDTNYQPPNVGGETDVEAEYVKESPAKRKRTATSYGRYTHVSELRRSETQPLTPTAIEPEIQLTPALTPASVGTSVASTSPVAKARAAGKQKRRIRSKRELEVRVTPERYFEVMAVRRKGMAAEGHEDVVRGSTRSGKIRAI